MPHLILSKDGYEALVRELGAVPKDIWLNPDVLADAEIAALHAEGVAVSRFAEAVNVEDPEALAYAVDTIRQHSPGQGVWVQLGEP